jgi:outer membrane lipoprotein-sorting protein
MKLLIRWAAITVAMLVVASATTHAQSAIEIVRKADLNMRGESSESEIVMTIVRPNWSRAITMKGWSMGTQYSMVYITAPARDAGTSFLKRRNEIWNWVPNIGRTVKLPPSMMMQSWMGSDFTNDDLVRESSIVDDYTHTLLGEDTIEGFSCHKIEMKPKPDAPVVWDRVLVWISKDDYLQLRSEFYDEFGALVNIMVGSDVKVFDGRKIPSRLEMIPVDKKGHKTIMEYKKLTFKTNLKEDFFSVANMRRVN